MKCITARTTPNLNPSPCQFIKSNNHTINKMILQPLKSAASRSLIFSSSSSLSSKLPFLAKSTSFSSSSIKMSSSEPTPTTTIEHIVMFKTKPGTDPSKVSEMIGNLNGLTSLEQIVHLTAGPIHKTKSKDFTFTHMLHCRYNSKQDLSDYSAHPSHMSVVKESVLPICEDIMAVDWVNSNVNGALVPKPGSVMRVTFMKLKEGLGESEKNEVLELRKSVKEYFPTIEQTSVGENFSPARAKDFSLASISFYAGMSEMETSDSNSSSSEVVAARTKKAREYLDDMLVVDYVIPSSSQASL